MNRLGLIVILLLLNFSSFGQKKKLSIPIDTKGDSSFWYKRIQRYYGKNGLADLPKSSESLQIRISTIEKSVDISTNDFITFKGTVAALLEFSDKDQKQDFRILSKAIEPSIARQIYEIYVSYNLSDIPTQNEIEGWSDGFDGTEILIEHATTDFYSFKEYWSPYSFPEIQEARKINIAYTKIWSLIQYIQFSPEELPKGYEFQYSGIKSIPIELHKKTKRKLERKNSTQTPKKPKS